MERRERAIVGRSRRSMAEDEGMGTGNESNRAIRMITKLDGNRHEKLSISLRR